MRRAFACAILAVGVAIFAAPELLAQGGPLQPLVRIFKEPVDTLRGLVQPKHRTRTAPVPAAETATPATAPTAKDESGDKAATATVTEQAVAANPDAAVPAEVPTPRVRPGEPARIPETPPSSIAQQEAALAAMAAADDAALGDAPDTDAVASAAPEDAPAEPLGFAPSPPASRIVLPNLRPTNPAPAPAKPQLASLGGGALGSAAACSRNLASLNVTALKVAPIAEGTCGVVTPVAMAALDGGALQLSTKAIVNCNLAATFAAWMRDTVDPLAQRFLGGKVAGLRVAASYACRTRDGIPGAKMSEHAYGNAIDIAAFEVNGDWVEVGGHNGVAGNAFLAAVRKSACGPFTTVLGPGSDSYHATHFHLDLAQRGKSGHSLYCH